ncbi:MAG: amidohydrolase [Chloroflexi bacterium]|nr:amidohydrolase [Chloroflexota bacterium]
MTSIIIDALTHISVGPDDVVGWGPRFLAEDLLAQMDASRKVLGEPARIDKAVVFPSLGLTVPTSPLSFAEQHAYVVESVAAHPDRFIGGIVIHPRLWNDQVADTVRKMVHEQGFRMLYLNPSLHKFWLPIKTPSEGTSSRQLLYPIFETAQELGIPVIIHTGEQPYALPATVDFVAGAFPEVNIIIAHLGTQGEMFTIEALLVADRHANVYLETSWAMPHMLIEAVHEAGAERLIFGSNCPPLEPTQQLMNVEEALTFAPPIGMGASAEDTRKVLGGNLARLLGLS